MSERYLHQEQSPQDKQGGKKQTANEVIAELGRKVGKKEDTKKDQNKNK
jgi:hypothetical protein